jgi:hypothetical protein
MLAWWTLIATLVLTVGFGSCSRIAVCLNGQVSTLLPEFRAESLLSSNVDHLFTIFANLKQVAKANSTSIDMREVSPHTMNDSETTAHLQTMLRHNKHITVASVQIFQVQPRDRNLYSKHGMAAANNYMAAVQSNHLCLKQIGAYEQAWRRQFDYVISTREDVMYFMPMNITALLRNLHPSNVDERQSGGQCDGIYQDCMGQAGYSLRFALYTRSAASVMMTNERLGFYSDLLESTLKAGNFNLIDRMQASKSGLSMCALPSEKVPITASRYIGNGTMCLVDHQLQGCVAARLIDRLSREVRCED